jgi:hypothetical protein
MSVIVGRADWTCGNERAMMLRALSFITTGEMPREGPDRLMEIPLHDFIAELRERKRGNPDVQPLRKRHKHGIVITFKRKCVVRFTEGEMLQLELIREDDNANDIYKRLVNCLGREERLYLNLSGDDVNLVEIP